MPTQPGREAGVVISGQPRDQIAALRQLLRDRGLDAWIVPSTDPHQSEYVAAHWQARAWLSGFRGSAGTLVLTQTSALLWTDPRYHIRAALELAGSGIVLQRMGLAGTLALEDWLCHELPAGAVVGFDASLISAAEADRLRAVLAEAGIVTADSLDDPLAQIWLDRPALPLAPIGLHPDAFSGESRADKLARIRAAMRRAGVAFHLLPALDDIAWTLNIRGSDIDYNPVAVCYALIGEQDAQLFIEPEKVPPQVRAALELDGVLLRPYGEVLDCLSQLPSNARILVDPEKTHVGLRDRISAHCRVKNGPSLPGLLKTVKNPLEQEGIRRMQRRDGAALVRWLCWLERQLAMERITEIGAAQKLADFRAEGEHFVGLSFHTICGYGPNSAVGHYQTDPRSDPVLRPSGILLVDSGGQYRDGTSDITRTISLGQPSPAEKHVFTTVLKSHIRLAGAVFPRGSCGSQLDALAREPLWRQGWNCRHGIGHGVGCFLNVHEGPIRFSPLNSTVLEAGMLVSNEPGVYFEGEFGVRLENLLLVQPGARTAFGDFLSFETVSLCPFDLNLLERELLDGSEAAWLNAYHLRVWESLAPLLPEEARVWLERSTRPV